MSRELEALKRELDCRMLDFAKMSGTNKQRAEVYRTLQVIQHIESLHSCPNCKHWGKECNRLNGRRCADFFEAKKGDMDE